MKNLVYEWIKEEEKTFDKPEIFYRKQQLCLPDSICTYSVFFAENVINSWNAIYGPNSWEHINPTPEISFECYALFPALNTINAPFWRGTQQICFCDTSYLIINFRKNNVIFCSLVPNDVSLILRNNDVLNSYIHPALYTPAIKKSITKYSNFDGYQNVSMINKQV